MQIAASRSCARLSLKLHFRCENYSIQEVVVRGDWRFKDDWKNSNYMSDQHNKNLRWKELYIQKFTICQYHDIRGVLEKYFIGIS